MALRVSTSPLNNGSSEAFVTVRVLLSAETPEHGHIKIRIVEVEQQLVDVMNRLANDQTEHELRDMRCPYHGY